VHAEGFPRNPHGPACPGLVCCGGRGFSAPERESPGRFMADAWICRSPLAGDAFEASESKPRLQDQDQKRFLADAWICRSPLAGDAFEASESKPKLQDQDQDQKRFAHLRNTSYFLLSGQEKVAKEKASPLTRLADILSARSALGLRGLSTGHPALTTNWPTPGNRSMRCLNSGIHALAMPATLRAFLRPTAASEGPRVEQRAIVARTFRTSQSPAPVGARLRAMLSKLQSQSQNRLHAWACFCRGVGMLRQREGVVAGAPPWP